VKFSSVKHALGWYVARRKGPAKLRAFNAADKATKTAFIDNTMIQITIAQLLHSKEPTGLALDPRGKDLAKLLEWASTSDDAGIEVDQVIVGELGTLLEEAGLLERVVPPQGGYHEFVDLNTGRKMRTWKEKQ
jgi:hypothetical protein